MSVVKIDHNDMGKFNEGWLRCWCHFSYESYHNPQRMNYGQLRVLNDNTINPCTGFDIHPHKNTEILIYVVTGSLTHDDNLENNSVLSKGDIQYISAGTGILHSELNHENDNLRIMQMWFNPDMEGYFPQYRNAKINPKARENKFLHLVSGYGGMGLLNIHQDVNIYVSEFDPEHPLYFSVSKNRQVYLVALENGVKIGNADLSEKDGAEITEDFILKAKGEKTHIMVIEMAR